MLEEDVGRTVEPSCGWLVSKVVPSDCAVFTVGSVAEVLIKGDDEVRYPMCDWRLTRGGGVVADLMMIHLCQQNKACDDSKSTISKSHAIQFASARSLTLGSNQTQT